MVSSSQQEVEQDTLIILLVEDNPGDVYLAQEALEVSGLAYALTAIDNGTEAVDMLLQKAGDGQLPDLIILDLNLPGKSGAQVMAEMEASRPLKHLPVAIFTSSLADRDIGSRFPGLRTTYSSKTASFTQLVEIMKEFARFARRG